MSWLVVDIHARAVNAQNCYAVYGLPAPSAYAGFIHALCLRAGVTPPASPQFAIGIHSAEVCGADSRYLANFALLRSAHRDIKHNSKDTQTQLDIPRLNLHATLVTDIDTTNADEDIGEHMQKALYGMGFAGGTLIHTLPGAGEATQLYLTDEAKQVNRVLFGAKLMRDASDWLSKAPTHNDLPDEDLFDRMLAYLAAPSKDGSQRRYGPRPTQGQLVPTCVGYRLMETPRTREGARKGYPHAFADPLIGLAELVTFSQLYGPEASGIQANEMWRYTRQNDCLLFTKGGLSNG